MSKGKFFAFHPYRYSTWDRDMASVARRFRMELARICDASRRLNREKWAHIEASDWAREIEDGQLINVPLVSDEQMLQWVSCNVAGSLKEICAKKNQDKARVGLPALTPQFLWLHVVNSGMRSAYLQRRRQQQDDLDRDPSAVSIPEGEVIWIPYADTVDAGTIRAATHTPEKKDVAANNKNVVATRPDWISDLFFHLDAIRDTTERLAQANRECDDLRQKGAIVTAHIAGLRVLIETMKDKAHGCDVTNLLEKMTALEDRAWDELTVNPASFIELQADKDRQSLSKTLRDALRWDGLKTLVNRAFSDPKFEINGVPLVNTISDVLRRGYEVWGDGYYGTDHAQDLQDAVALAGTAKDGNPNPEAKTALASVMSLLEKPLRAAGAGATVAAPVIGNLPGPANLAVAVVKLISPIVLKAAIASRERVGKIGEQLRDLLKKWLLREAKHEAAFLELTDEIVKASGKLGGKELGKVLEHMKTLEVKPKVEKLAKDIAESTHGTMAWHSAVALVNILVLFYVLESEDSQPVRKVVNLAGAGITALLGLTKLGSPAASLMFASSPAWSAKMLQFTKALNSDVAAGVFGTVGAVVAIASGAISLWDAYERHGTTLDYVAAGTQVVGGVLLFAAAIMVAGASAPAAATAVAASGTVIGLEIGASLMLVASAVTSGWAAIADSSVPGTQKVAVYHLGEIGKASAYLTVSRSSSALKKAYLDVKAALDTAVFKDFVDYYAADAKFALSRYFGTFDLSIMFAPGRPGMLPVGAEGTPQDT
jgi:hypothetical protein